MFLRLPLIIILLLIITSACENKKPAVTASNVSTTSPTTEEFSKLWFAGKAELTSYKLQQARYGELRDGEAVLIFVTEDFSPDKLVKLDEPEKSNDKVKILKLNFTKKFYTGVYPYSMMTSTFTPVSSDGKQATVKVSCSSQEWCGHTYSSLSLKSGSYDWSLHSYFEKENEQHNQQPLITTEDEIWTRIRINPASLPTGNIKLLPSLIFQRLSHTQMKEEAAVATLSADTAGVQHYTINYPSHHRTISITFTSAFPHTIEKWEESYEDGFGSKKKFLTTKAVLKKRIWLDYWQHNSNADSTYRDSLQLLKHG